LFRWNLQPSRKKEAVNR